MIFVMSSEVETSLDVLLQKIIRDSSTTLRFARNDIKRREVFMKQIESAMTNDEFRMTKENPND